LNPGPGLFESSGDIVYAMILSLFVGNVLILVYGLAGSQYFGKLAYIPIRYIIPSVAVLAVVGGFAVRNAPVDLYIVLIFGVIGILFVSYDYPLVSLVLGVILGDLAESGFVTGWLLTGESATAFLFNSYIAIGLLILIALSLAVTLVKN
jgi:putative tricarboxylic transport membrane protein